MRNGNGNDDGVCASGAQREWREEEEEEEEEEAGAEQCHELRSVREAEVMEEEEGARGRARLIWYLFPLRRE